MRRGDRRGLCLLHCIDSRVKILTYLIFYNFEFAVSNTRVETRELGSASFPVGSRKCLYFAGHMPCLPGERMPFGSTAAL